MASRPLFSYNLRMHEDYGINLKLPLSYIETLRELLRNAPCQNCVAGIRETLEHQTEEQMAQNRAFDELFTPDRAKVEDAFAELRASKKKAAEIDARLKELESKPDVVERNLLNDLRLRFPALEVGVTLEDYSFVIRGWVRTNEGPRYGAAANIGDAGAVALIPQVLADYLKAGGHDEG